ncbi:MAG: RNA 3'-terminal phosphate cyclase [Anaerolineae bacterium]
MMIINGAHGEGGGQILRSAVGLAAITGKAINIHSIRAGRKKPGLAAQHLTAVRAAAMICDAVLHGDELGSTWLSFTPQSPPVAGLYEFNVADARQGGSAGAATLVLQTVIPPLALADAPSTVTVRGGTHVPWSPPFHYLRDAYLPALARLGFRAGATLGRWGFHPAGEGEITVNLPGGDRPTRPAAAWANRGELVKISGVAVASSLPAHIAQRIRNRAANLLDAAGLPHDIQPELARSTSPGAGIFLAAEYRHSRAGFGALGAKGKPSEQVAQEAVDDLLAFHAHGAAVDAHLADQLIVPLALSSGPGLILPVQAITEHTRTNLWLVEQFLGPVARLDVERNILEFFRKEKANRE